jgi:hypothetical protein
MDAVECEASEYNADGDFKSEFHSGSILLEPLWYVEELG